MGYNNEILTKIVRSVRHFDISSVKKIVIANSSYDGKMQLSSEQTIKIATLFSWLTSKYVNHS